MRAYSMDLRVRVLKVLRATEQARPDRAAQRSLWQVERSGWDPARLVFLAETWTYTALTRL